MIDWLIFPSVSKEVGCYTLGKNSLKKDNFSSQLRNLTSEKISKFLLAPLEFPKLANAQPSNFGPLPIKKLTVFVVIFPTVLQLLYISWKHLRNFETSCGHRP